MLNSTISPVNRGNKSNTCKHRSNGTRELTTSGKGNLVPGSLFFQPLKDPGGEVVAKGSVSTNSLPYHLARRIQYISDPVHKK